MPPIRQAQIYHCVYDYLLITLEALRAAVFQSPLPPPTPPLGPPADALLSRYTAAGQLTALACVMLYLSCCTEPNKKHS